MATITVAPTGAQTSTAKTATRGQPQPPRCFSGEARWRRRAEDLERRVHELTEQLHSRDVEIRRLKARVAWLEQQLFGKKSECTDPAPQPPAPDDADASNPPEPSDDHEEKKRGKPPGSKGHGRRPRKGLPVCDVVHELSDGQARCPKCGCPFLPFPGTEDSEEIHWEVRLVRHRHRRKRYVPTCACGAVPGIVTAPAPPKLIPKGLFACDFWVRIVLAKFLFQTPLYRVREMLALEGLDVSQGTLTGGLRRIGALLESLYEAILERSRTANHWHMDETRWAVFVSLQGKEGHRWWLWVVITKDTCCYLIEPTRSAEVPIKHLGENPEGILNVDRYAVYKTLGPGMVLAFCWSHARRDFVRIRDVSFQ
jgi:transposase